LGNAWRALAVPHGTSGTKSPYGTPGTLKEKPYRDALRMEIVAAEDFGVFARSFGEG
jgi:hypothetical protein